MQNDDEIRLVIKSREVKNWTGVTITMALDQAADAFSVEAPFDPERTELLEVFQPFGYQPVQVSIGKDPVLTGRVDRVDYSLAAAERTVNVQGRSLTGVLVDCEIEGSLEFHHHFLADLATELCKPFGIEVDWQNNRPLEFARAEYGQKIYDFLNSLAAPARLFLYSATDGKLVISWAKKLLDQAATAALIEGESPLLSVSASFDGSKRFSSYTVATQFAGEPDIEGTVPDIGVLVHRPHLSAEGDADADPRQTAARRRMEAFASAFSVTATVTGWRAPGGKLWAKGDAVTLRAPSCALIREIKYTAVGITLKIDTTEGKVTELRLIPPEILAGQTLKTTPWAPRW